MPDLEYSFNQKLSSLDVSLLSSVPSSATLEDRRALLALHLASRSPNYSYLEIGSEMGGSLQAHLMDPWCARVFSIDLRVDTAHDFRGTFQWYSGNTTAAMRSRLTQAFPDADLGKLITFDMEAATVRAAALVPAPALIFIDAEHTDRAAWADFRWARKVVSTHGWIAFHDAHLVCGAIRQALADLKRQGIEHAAGQFSGSSVFAIALGGEARPRLTDLGLSITEPELFFKQANGLRRKERFDHWRNRLAWTKVACRQQLKHWRQAGRRLLGGFCS
jgi:hypothetical protein